MARGDFVHTVADTDGDHCITPTEFIDDSGALTTVGALLMGGRGDTPNLCASHRRQERYKLQEGTSKSLSLDVTGCRL